MSTALLTSNLDFETGSWSIIDHSSSASTLKIVQGDGPQKAPLGVGVSSDFFVIHETSWSATRFGNSWMLFETLNTPPTTMTILADHPVVKKSHSLRLALKEIAKADNSFASFCRAASFILGSIGLASQFGTFAMLVGAACGAAIFFMSIGPIKK